MINPDAHSRTADRIEVLEHDLVFLARALIRALNHAELEETAAQTQKLVDFYERKDQWPQ